MAENEKARCLEFLLEEAKKEVGEKQNWIDMCHDVQYTQAETLGQKSREIQRLTQENVRLQQENAALHALHYEAKLAAPSPKTMLVNDLHDQKLHLPLSLLPDFHGALQGPGHLQAD